MQDAMRQGNWTARGNPHVHRISGQTLGLIGLGKSAQAVAHRAAAFGLKLLGWARNPAKHRQAAASDNVELVRVEKLLAESDYLSIHLPLTEETRHFLSAERLQLLKPTAVIINTSRGAVIDETALIEALQRKRIGGAALDVFETIDVFAPPGPPPSHPLLELDNVLATPHCAGSSVESTYESKLRGARHAGEVLLGRWPPHVVNPDVSPRWSLAKSP
jgi:D-3-phosphoglycerate dehydrogenase